MVFEGEAKMTDVDTVVDRLKDAKEARAPLSNRVSRTRPNCIHPTRAAPSPSPGAVAPARPLLFQARPPALALLAPSPPQILREEAASCLAPARLPHHLARSATSGDHRARVRPGGGQRPVRGRRHCQEPQGERRERSLRYPPRRRPHARAGAPNNVLPKSPLSAGVNGRALLVGRVRLSVQRA
eukprot:1213224-Pleurochrysis_carterae.AAC.5